MDKYSRYACGAISDLATPTGAAATLGVVCCTSDIKIMLQPFTRISMSVFNPGHHK